MELFIAAGVPSAFVAFCFWLLERQIQKRAEVEKDERTRRQKEQDEKEKNREKFRKSENTYGKHSLPAMRKKKGLTDKEPETWWGVQTHVTDRQSRCSGKYNPTTRDGKLNFEWLLEECHRIFDDKSGRNEMLAQKASELFEEE